MNRLQPWSVLRTVDLTIRGIYCKLAGEADACDVPAIEAALLEWMHENGGPCILDLKDVGYLESHGIKMLLRLRSDTFRRGVALILVTNAFQNMLLKITRLEPLFTVAESEAEASEILLRSRE
jgi:anti-anti-sigma factor